MSLTLYALLAPYAMSPAHFVPGTTVAWHVIAASQDGWSVLHPVTPPLEPHSCLTLIQDLTLPWCPCNHSFVTSIPRAPRPLQGALLVHIDHVGYTQAGFPAPPRTDQHRCALQHVLKPG